MSQGYLILASSRDNDSIRQAHALAMSLKYVDDTRETCVVVDTSTIVTDEFTAFDYVIELPFTDTDTGESDININLWQIYYATPFDDTLYIDRRSVVMSDIECVWDSCKHVDFSMPTSTLTYRGDNAKYKTKYKSYSANGIPVSHTGLIYFKQSVTASEIFKFADVVFKNWRKIYKDFVKEYQPAGFNAELLMNISLLMSGNSNEGLSDLTYVDTDLDTLQHLDDEHIRYDWTEFLSVWLYNSILKISNYRVYGVINYGDSEFLNQEIYDGISSIYNSRK